MPLQEAAWIRLEHEQHKQAPCSERADFIQTPFSCAAPMACAAKAPVLVQAPSTVGLGIGFGRVAIEFSESSD